MALATRVTVAVADHLRSIAYGPCDNGPLITCDVTGLCRIWDCSPRRAIGRRLSHWVALLNCDANLL
jgi:hypothetical protein